MSKPLGMTPFFQIVHPTRFEDLVWDMVEEARRMGKTLEEIKAEVLECWTETARQALAEAEKETWR